MKKKASGKLPSYACRVHVFEQSLATIERISRDVMRLTRLRRLIKRLIVARDILISRDIL